MPEHDLAELLAVLEDADDPDSPERPGGFDFDVDDEAARFHDLADAIVDALGDDCAVEGWPLIENASFVGEVRLPERLWSGEPSGVRVSNFGRLATVKGVETLDRRTAAVLRELLDQHGYTYIPMSVLEQPYHGPNAAAWRMRDWWDRYFEFV